MKERERERERERESERIRRGDGEGAGPGICAYRPRRDRPGGPEESKGGDTYRLKKRIDT